MAGRFGPSSPAVKCLALRLVEANPESYKQLGEAKLLNQRQEVWACMSFSDAKLLVRDNKQMQCPDLRGKLPGACGRIATKVTIASRQVKSQLVTRLGGWQTADSR
jgi:hypothetical protein